MLLIYKRNMLTVSSFVDSLQILIFRSLLVLMKLSVDVVLWVFGEGWGGYVYLKVEGWFVVDRLVYTHTHTHTHTHTYI